MHAIRDRLVLLAYSAGWLIVRKLPERWAYALFRRLADRMWRQRGAGVRRLEVNLARVLGPTADQEQLRTTSRAALRSYMCYWCDAFRLPDWSPDKIVSRVRVENEHRIRDPLAAGQGLVVPLPHTGNWDWAGAWACVTGVSVTTVAERLRPEELFRRFLAFRESLGMEILPLTGTDGVFPTLVRRVKAGALVPLLADRDLTESGIEVKFFGETASMPAGPAALALATGAPVVPATLWYEGEPPQHRLVIRFHEPVPTDARGDRADRIAAVTQRIAAVFEQGIGEHPHSWHMLQRVWVADVPSRRQR